MEWLVIALLAAGGYYWYENYGPGAATSSALVTDSSSVSHAQSMLRAWLNSQGATTTLAYTGDPTPTIASATTGQPTGIATDGAFVNALAQLQAWANSSGFVYQAEPGSAHQLLRTDGVLNNATYAVLSAVATLISTNSLNTANLTTGSQYWIAYPAGGTLNTSNWASGTVYSGAAPAAIPPGAPAAWVAAQQSVDQIAALATWTGPNGTGDSNVFVFGPYSASASASLPSAVQLSNGSVYYLSYPLGQAIDPNWTNVTQYTAAQATAGSGPAAWIAAAQSPTTVAAMANWSGPSGAANTTASVYALYTPPATIGATGPATTAAQAQAIIDQAASAPVTTTATAGHFEMR